MNPKDTLDKINELVTIERTNTTLSKEGDKWCLGVCKDYKFDENATQFGSLWGGDDLWVQYYLFDTKKEAEIEGIILGVEQEDLTIEDIAKVLDIDDRKSLCIGGLNYYYGDGMIGAYYPKSDEICVSWTAAREFRLYHDIFITADLREYMR